MLIVPLSSVPSQIINVNLNSQICKIDAYQRSNGFYLDLYLNDVLIVGGVECHDRNLLVRDAYLGFSGDLAFVDSQGTDDPSYDGLGTRWTLDYFLPSELTQSAVVQPFWTPTVPTPTPTPTPVPTPTPTPTPTATPGVPTNVTIT